MGSIAELREEMLVLEKYWERGIELHSVGVLDGEEFGEWGAACMSAMLLMGIDGIQFVVKMRSRHLKGIDPLLEAFRSRRLAQLCWAHQEALVAPH